MESEVMVDVGWAIQEMGSVFRSEDQLKLALGAELGRMYGSDRIRSEWEGLSDRSIDLGVRRGDVTIPIEIKYRTRKAEVEDSRFSETFTLRTHSALDFGCYGVLRDLERIEEIVEKQGKYGFVLFMTNDSAYWEDSGQEANYDQFRLYENRSVHGSLDWERDPPNSSVDQPLDIRGRYELEWRDYEYDPEIEVSSNDSFRYLLVKVD